MSEADSSILNEGSQNEIDPGKAMTNFCTQLEEVLPKTFSTLTALIEEYQSVNFKIRNLGRGVDAELAEVDQKNMEILKSIHGLRLSEGISFES